VCYVCVSWEKPAHGATRHTSQKSSEVVVAAAVADSNAPEVVAVDTGACLSSIAAAVVPRGRGCIGTQYKRRQNG